MCRSSCRQDDPLLFGPRLLDEYETVRTHLGLSDQELAQAASYSFTHSMAPEAIRQKGLAGIELWLETSPAS